MKNEDFAALGFLKPNFSDFNFEFKQGHEKQDVDKLKQELLLVQGKKDTIILINGNVVYKNLNPSIKVSVAKSNRVVLDYLKKRENNTFLQENKKHLNSSLVINVKGCGAKQQINIVFAATKQLYHATFIFAEKQSEVQVYEKTIGKQKAKLNHALHINAKENSHVKYIGFQKLASSSSQVMLQTLNACRDSSIKFDLLNLNKSNTVNLTYGNLLEQGANISTRSCVFASDNSLLKSLMLLNHRAKNSFSQIENLAVVNKNSSVEIDGIGYINQGQCKSNAQQKNKIITLTPTAKVVVNPQLIINEFDVKAGHAAAVGGVDENQIYYLQSRGLERRQALELLLFAFAESFLTLLPEDEKKHALRLIRKRIK